MTVLYLDSYGSIDLFPAKEVVDLESWAHMKDDIVQETSPYLALIR